MIRDCNVSFNNTITILSGIFRERRASAGPLNHTDEIFERRHVVGMLLLQWQMRENEVLRRRSWWGVKRMMGTDEQDEGGQDRVG